MNFPAYEKLAEDRINKYMAAQGIDKNKVSEKHSQKNYEQGRWEIHYKFEDEENIFMIIHITNQRIVSSYLFVIEVFQFKGA